MSNKSNKDIEPNLRPPKLAHRDFYYDMDASDKTQMDSKKLQKPRARWGYRRSRYIGENSEGNRFIRNDEL